MRHVRALSPYRSVAGDNPNLNNQASFLSQYAGGPGSPQAQQQQQPKDELQIQNQINS